MKVTALSRSNNINMTIESNAHRPDTIHREISSPNGLPEWTKNRNDLWHQVEQCEPRIDALLARKFEGTVPNSIPKEGVVSYCREFVNNNILNEKGLIADWSIQEKEGRSVLSMLVPGREIHKSGFGNKTNVFNKSKLGTLKQMWKEPLTKDSPSQKNNVFQHMAELIHIEWKMSTIAASSNAQQEKTKLLKPLKEQYHQAAEKLMSNSEKLGLSPDLIGVRTKLHLNFTEQMVKENVRLPTPKKTEAEKAPALKALVEDALNEFKLMKAEQDVRKDPSTENKERYIEAAKNYTDSTKNLMKKSADIGIPEELSREKHTRNMEGLSKQQHLKDARDPTTAETLAALTIAMARQIKDFCKSLLRIQPKDKPKKQVNRPSPA